MWTTSAVKTAVTGAAGTREKARMDAKTTAARIMSSDRRADGARIGKAGDK